MRRWLLGYAEMQWSTAVFKSAYDRTLSHFTLWHISLACADHDAQNALKWGVLPCLLDVPDHRQFYRNLHKAIAGVRDSFGLLIDHIQGWLVAVIDWRIVPLKAYYEYYELWTTLGLPPKLATRFADLALDFIDGVLCVNALYKDVADIVEDIAADIMALLHWHDFSDTRWGGVGHSTRPAVGGMVVGFDSLVDYIRGFAHIDYHVGQWNLFDADCRWSCTKPSHNNVNFKKG